MPMRPTMGGEDFSAYQQKAPGVFAFVGAGNAEKGFDFPHHHPRFDIDERSLDIGLRYLLARDARPARLTEPTSRSMAIRPHHLLGRCPPPPSSGRHGSRTAWNRASSACRSCSDGSWRGSILSSVVMFVIGRLDARVAPDACGGEA